MHFDPNLPPEARKSPDPEQNKNNIFLAQALLMGRSPEGEEGWVARHAETFRQLYDKDEHFRELVNKELTDENLQRVQSRLNEEDEAPS